MGTSGAPLLDRRSKSANNEGVGRKTPIKNKLSTAELVSSVECIDEVDDMLLNETTSADVARFIQRDRGLLLDVKEATLSKILGERRRNLLEAAEGVPVEVPDDTGGPVGVPPTAPRSELDGPVGEHAAMQDAYRPRVPGAIARGAYKKAQLGVDKLIELESLYLSCRDRIGTIMEWEIANDRFWGDLHKEFATAAKIIEIHAKIQSEMGPPDFSVRLDVRGMQSKFGNSVAEVFSKPESRHKVLALMEQLKQVGQLSDVIDVESSEG